MSHAFQGLKVNQQTRSKPRWHLMTSGRPEQVTERLNKLIDPFGEILKDWWLAERAAIASTPHWDIASQCTIDGDNGLLLIEAKAHLSELKVDDACGSLHKNNCHQIKRAIAEANDDFNTLFHGWHLSNEHHYQLSNRFAWSWKIACLGIPVVLVYLGFLKADEMQDPFTTERSWEQAIRGYGKGVVPDSVWNSKMMINHTPLYVLIRSKEMPLC